MAMKDKRSALPSSLPPRGLSRIEAAEYIGVSPSLFDQMVLDGRMPQPKPVNARLVWDRHEIDRSFAELPPRVNVEDDVWEKVAV